MRKTRQQKLSSGADLLDQNGRLQQMGYATDFIVRYNREAIKRPQSEIREWDYHLALHQDYAVGVSIASVGDQSRVSIHFVNFKEGYHICETDFQPHPIPVPRSPFGGVQFKSERSEGTYVRENDRTFIKLSMKDFGKAGQDFSALLEFTVPKTDKMVLVVPYADPELFYYNYKVNCMPVMGYANLDGAYYTFKNDNCIGTNDWGRGIWEPVNQWYWGSASGEINGKPFGLNIGHGFGDNNKATENMLFYDGVCHKLDQVTFRIPGDVIGDLKLILPDENYLMPWKFESNDGRLDLEFIPIHDRQSGVQLAEYLSVQHQVFGHFNGQVTLDDGTVLELKDFFGFAEKVGNDWR